MFKTSSATFSVAVTGEDVAPLSLYRVIDVSAGSVATRYPVVYRNDVPMGGWGDEYKTDKIVLRRIDKPSGAYYAGIFEITEAQWDRVMGWSSTSTKPKGSVSCSAIRGNAGAYDWPSSGAVDPTSFVGRLRQKTGLSALDQPSEAEWECAAQMRGDSTTCTGTCWSGVWSVGRATTAAGCCAAAAASATRRAARYRTATPTTRPTAGASTGSGCSAARNLNRAVPLPGHSSRTLRRRCRST